MATELTCKYCGQAITQTHTKPIKFYAVDMPQDDAINRFLCWIHPFNAMQYNYHTPADGTQVIA